MCYPNLKYLSSSMPVNSYTFFKIQTHCPLLYLDIPTLHAELWLSL